MTRLAGKALTVLVALSALAFWDYRALLAGLGIVTVLAILDYRNYAARTNAFAVWAWLVTRYLEATRGSLERFSMDTRLLKHLADKTASFLNPDEIPVRSGDRPRMVYGLPHRQLTQHPDPATRTSFRERLAQQSDLKDLATDRLTFKSSQWELTGAEALIVTDCQMGKCNKELRRAKGEFAHLHSHDGSMHMLLSPQDTLMVIAKGWGDLFAVSGALWGKVPHVVLVYAPRNREEEDIVSRMVRAAYQFGTSANQEET